MSGVSLGPWATPFGDELDRTRKHAFYLGAKKEDIDKWTNQELVDFLRSQDAADITEAETKLRVRKKYHRITHHNLASKNS